MENVYRMKYRGKYVKGMEGKEIKIMEEKIRKGKYVRRMEGERMKEKEKDLSDDDEREICDTNERREKMKEKVKNKHMRKWKCAKEREKNKRI